MPYGLYISAEGAQAQTARLEIVANNLANVDTVGFKRQLAICQARYAEAVQQGLQSPGSGGLDDIGGGVVVRQSKTDFSPGVLKRTGSPNDLAIDGDGFFQVRKGGETLLTRAGNFRIGPTGELATQQGYTLLSDSGAPIAVSAENGPWEVDGSGTLRQSGNEPQNIGLAKPASNGDLLHVGENLYRPLAAVTAVPEGERHIIAGHQELSDVHPTTEMTDLIEISRLVEANVNMMKTQDQMLANLISRVLKV